MPAAGTQYDPTNQLPSVQPGAFPEPTPAMPSPLPTEQPQVNGAVKQSGAIATMADGILRGFMQGRAYHQAAQVMKLKKKSDDLQNSYQQDAQRLYQMTQSGVDQNSDEYKAAKSSVDGSWGALMDFYGQHVEAQDSGKKKSKAKQIEGGILGALQSKDPMEVSRAWYQVAQKAGPPIYGQIATLNTPEAKAQRQAQATTAQAGSVKAGNTLAREQAEKQRNDILAIPEDQRTDAQKAQLKSAEEILTPPAKATTEFEQTRASIARKVAEDPNYVLTDSEKNILGGGKPTYPKPPGSAAALKPGTFGYALTQKYGPTPTFEQYMESRREEAKARHVSGGAGSSEDKAYQKWHGYYKEHYPDMGEDEWDTLARRKIEGIGQMVAGQIGTDAATQPKQFDSDVIASAIDNLRKMPQYSGNSFISTKPSIMAIARKSRWPWR